MVRVDRPSSSPPISNRRPCGQTPAKSCKTSAPRTIDYTDIPLAERVRALRPDGTDALLDLISDRESFAQGG
jgi:hypothetical protein